MRELCQFEMGEIQEMTLGDFPGFAKVVSIKIPLLSSHYQKDQSSFLLIVLGSALQHVSCSPFRGSDLVQLEILNSFLSSNAEQLQKIVGQAY